MENFEIREMSINETFTNLLIVFGTQLAQSIFVGLSSLSAKRNRSSYFLQLP